MRYITIVALSLSILLCGAVYAAKAPSLSDQFRHPGPEYRPAPFFSWNDDLNGGELAWQIKEMRAHGYGASFLHARVGRITPYMGEQWMNCIAYSAKESKALGNYAWLYDEDRWPSGFAGGIVPAKGMEYRAKSLDLREFDLGKDTKVEEQDGQLMVNGLSNIIALYSCTKTGDRLTNPKKLPLQPIIGLPDGTHILVFRKNVRDHEERFNGFSYVDTLEPKVVKAFIDANYEPYYAKLGAACGKEVPGIFTDEPGISPMAWTESLPDQFKQRYGYDLIAFLPSLFYEVGDWQRIRHDYRSLTCDMFVEAYSKQIYQWCDKHHLQFTGHYLAEDTLVSQLKVAGACMPHYEYMHMPGIDHLFRRLGEVSLIKQVSSAANQLGKRRVLSETFGGSGWNMNFADQKWIADWQFALGVNFMNPHLCHYSLRGTRKRDWPPSIYFQQPYWKYYSRVNDYMGRASLMLSRGDYVADVLVIHPISSAWCLYSQRDESKANALSDQFRKLSTNLLQLHREFDYGDEKLMAKYAKVDQKNMVVGRMRYKAVVLPSCVTLSRSTFKLLQDFVKAGGSVIAVRPTPVRLDGLESPEVAAFFKQTLPNLAIVGDGKDDVGSALREAVPPGVSVRDALGLEQGHVVCHRRREGNRQIIFLANTDLKDSYSVTLRVDGVGRAEDWDLEKGTASAVPSRLDGKGIAVDLLLPGGGSKLLVIDETAKPVLTAAHHPMRAFSQDLSDAWRVQRHGPNSLTLDYCRYRIGDGEWHGSVPVYQVQQTMEGQPDGTRVSLRFTFDLGFEPKGAPLYAVLEQPETHTIAVNGQPVQFRDAGWWVDKSFRKLDISKAVRAGENTVELTCKFMRPKKPGTLIYVNGGVELESIYIVGDFAVEPGSTRSDGPEGTTVADGGFRLMPESPVPIIGDLVGAGYPFFVGDIELFQDVDVSYMPEGQAYLEFEGINAIVAKVYVNGKDAGPVYWRPYRVDITPYLEKGSNRIQVVLTNSLRNLLGPLHHKAGELTVASPGSFVDGAKWTDSYHFVKLGIPDRSQIIWEE